jgi:hypothetical protein
VYLTAKEHFTVHWILTKMITGNFRYKMLHALQIMASSSNGQRRNLSPLEYSVVREARRLAKHSDETKIKIGKHHRGKPKSDEHRLKYSQAKKRTIT